MQSALQILCHVPLSFAILFFILSCKHCSQHLQATEARAIRAEESLLMHTSSRN
jgi:hypothetical protein